MDDIDTPGKTFALSFYDHKQSALFFDKIWPLHSMDSIPEDIHDISVPLAPFQDWAVDLIGDLIMTVSRSPPENITFKGRTFSMLHVLMGDKFYKNKVSAFADRQIHNRDKLLWVRVIAGALVYEFLTLLGGHNVIPVFNDYKLQKTFFSTEWMFIREPHIRSRPIESLHININNLRLIATDRAEWQQIKDFRSDEESLKKLRNLRAFFHDQYKDKDPNYISDDIDRRIDQYEEACKKHGFELTESLVTSILDPSSLFGVASLLAIAHSLGEPMAITASGISGAVLHTSKVFFEFQKKKLAFRSQRENHELAYIIQAKQNFEQPKKR